MNFNKVVFLDAFDTLENLDCCDFLDNVDCFLLDFSSDGKGDNSDSRDLMELSCPTSASHVLLWAIRGGGSSMDEWTIKDGCGEATGEVNGEASAEGKGSALGEVGRIECPKGCTLILLSTSISRIYVSLLLQGW
mmetsp:Transcript_44101/g.79348  ORF Transcript_44101/g.79348 Transcript_44101/m.79348 type:complete len:135 (-) Transcript_44101:14-418(-)